jgi:hypothetical protein
MSLTRAAALVRGIRV